MGKAQRVKGAVYEREVCDAFSAAYGQTFKRNIGQARDGGNDIDVGPLVVECKRRKTLTTIESWMAQAIAAIRPGRTAGVDTPMGHVPLVVARADSGESLAVLRFSDFLEIARPWFEQQAAREPHAS